MYLFYTVFQYKITGDAKWLEILFSKKKKKIVSFCLQHEKQNIYQCIRKIILIQRENNIVFSCPPRQSFFSYLKKKPHLILIHFSENKT